MMSDPVADIIKQFWPDEIKIGVETELEQVVREVLSALVQAPQTAWPGMLAGLFMSTDFQAKMAVLLEWSSADIRNELTKVRFNEAHRREFGEAYQADGLLPPEHLQVKRGDE